MQKCWVEDATKSRSRVVLVRLMATYESESLAYRCSEKSSST